MLAGTIALSGGQSAGGSASTPGRGGQQGTVPAEIQAARDQLQRDRAEVQRLTDVVKGDQQRHDPSLQHDRELLKTAREAVKQDQDNLKQLNQSRGRRGGGEGGRQGGGRRGGGGGAGGGRRGGGGA